MMLKRKSSRYPTAAQKREQRYPDCHGIEFYAHGWGLPEKVSDWPQIVRVQDDSIEAKMHEWWGRCWNCSSFGNFDGPVNDIQAHHIIAGTKGRADEFTNIAMLCADCHANANTDKLPMGRILFLKWREDRQHLSWVRLALLARRLLPDLILD